MNCTIASSTFIAEDVIRFYQQCQDLGIEIWLDGGWGVDALLSKQTRLHHDLDIVIQQKDVVQLREFLQTQSYKKMDRDDNREWNFVLADDKNRQIDIHVIYFDHNGKGIYGPPENNIFYPATSLNAIGLINNLEVKCLTADYQVQSHTGYKISAKDIHDVTLLCEKFKLELPTEYTSNT